MAPVDELEQRLERLAAEYESRRLKPKKLKKWTCSELRLPLRRPRGTGILRVWSGEDGEGGEDGTTN